MSVLPIRTMKLCSVVVATTAAVAGVLLIPAPPADASTIQCSELAIRFANGDINFDERLNCGVGQIEMTYGKYCSRTQGIVCTQGRGRD